MDVKQYIISYNDLNTFLTISSSIAKQVLELFKEHRKVKYMTFKQLIREHLAYSDNVKYDANLFILLNKRIVVAIACVEKNINGNFYISSVHVSEKYRKLGLCNIIIKCIIDYYPIHTHFVLGVIHDNIPAIHCYTKNGFVVTKTKKGYLNTIDTMEFIKN